MVHMYMYMYNYVPQTGKFIYELGQINSYIYIYTRIYKPIQHRDKLTCTVHVESQSLCTIIVSIGLSGIN